MTEWSLYAFEEERSFRNPEASQTMRQARKNKLKKSIYGEKGGKLEWQQEDNNTLLLVALGPDAADPNYRAGNELI